MKFPSALKQFLKPSLGKVGLSGIVFCLALGIYAPPAPVDVATTIQPHQPPLTVQPVVFSGPRR